VEKKLESGVRSGTSGIWRGGEAELPSISTTTRIPQTYAERMKKLFADII
jgi:hypothetical protein